MCRLIKKYHPCHWRKKKYLPFRYYDRILINLDGIEVRILAVKIKFVAPLSTTRIIYMQSCRHCA
jgi:hypothetical protein